jgi:hypothetical protein
MTTTVLLIAFAVAVLLVLMRTAHLRKPTPALDALEGYIQRVDLAAFRNLIDPGEEDYLRQQLPANKFRAVQRKRLRAMLQYVRCTADNAAILVRVGEACRRDQNPEVAAAARGLVNNALRLRLHAMLAMAALYGRLVLPGTRVSVGWVTDAYENLTQGLVRLARLQNPAYESRISDVI